MRRRSKMSGGIAIFRKGSAVAPDRIITQCDAGAKMKAVESWKAVGRGALDLVMPPLCLGCNRRTSEPRSLCSSCWLGFSFIEEPRCPLWGEPFAFDAGPGLVSARALETAPEWKSLTAA